MPVVVVAIIFFFISHSKQQPTLPDPTVKTISIAETEQAPTLEVSGFVRGSNRADIAPAASGRILKLFKHEGDFVKQGEILATLDATQTDAQISATNTNIHALEKTLQDAEKYYNQLVDEAKSADDNINTDASSEAVKSAKRARDLQIQATRDQLIAAQGGLKITQAGKSNFSVTAPFSGSIASVHGRVGEMANFGAPLFSVSSSNNFEIETYISSSDAREIFIGNLATFTLPNGAPISGVISAIANGADTQTLKTLVRIQLDNATNTLRLGDFLHGEISLTKKQATILIPNSAIVSRGGDSVVFLVDENNIAHEQSVKIGRESAGQVEILTGLSVGQQLVIEGQQYLINGVKTTTYGTK